MCFSLYVELSRDDEWLHKRFHSTLCSNVLHLWLSYVMLLSSDFHWNGKRWKKILKKTNGARKETKFNTQQLPISRLFLEGVSLSFVCVCASSLIFLSILRKKLKLETVALELPSMCNIVTPRKRNIESIKLNVNNIGYKFKRKTRDKLICTVFMAFSCRINTQTLAFAMCIETKKKTNGRISADWSFSEKTFFVLLRFHCTGRVNELFICNRH